MSRLYIDCPSGVAGDMLLGALSDLGVPRDELAHLFDRLLPTAADVSIRRTRKQGISALKVDVRYRGATMGHGEDPGPMRPGAPAAQDGWRWPRILARLDETIALSPDVRLQAIRVLETLALFLGRELQCSPEQLVFADATVADMLADVVGVLWAVDRLGVKEVSCLPLPQNETIEICTPTGRCLVAELSTRFGALGEGWVEAVGYGAGDLELSAQPNVLRLVLLS
jgi:uncharacterized protein (DUF111 family)